MSPDYVFYHNADDPPYLFRAGYWYSEQVLHNWDIMLMHDGVKFYRGTLV